MSAKKFGFTLAEVLITLGIIGVVAAMTIPALMTSYQKIRTANQLKAAYATLANAIRLSEEENGELSGWNLAGHNGINRFEEFLAPYLKATRRDIRANTLKYYSPGGRRETDLAIVRTRSAAFTLLNGVEYIFSDGSIIGEQGTSKAQTIGLIVDLNGYNSLPNRFGRDAFYFVINTDKGLIFLFSDDGEKGTVYKSRKQLLKGPSRYNYQCNKSGRGMWCGALIHRDGWTISKDYPW